MDTVLGYYLGSSRLLLANITNTTSNGGEAGSNGGGGSVHVPASSNERIRTILVVLYVCVLALCFLTPIVYYFRLHVEERHARRLRELEVAGIRSALERSSTDHAGESQAARRKYIEERRARILQLFRPVATVLKAENFPPFPGEEEIMVSSGQALQVQPAEGLDSALTGVGNVDGDEDDDDEGLAIRIPAPGLLFSNEANADYPLPPPSTDPDRPLSQALPHRSMRLVPGTCSICLSNYQVGAEVVWSSNARCDHCFHSECIERWLLRQREGPLCPCCRRDFIIDPYDVQKHDDEAIPRGTAEVTGDDVYPDDSHRSVDTMPAFLWERPHIEADETV